MSVGRDSYTSLYSYLMRKLFIYNNDHVLSPPRQRCVRHNANMHYMGLWLTVETVKFFRWHLYLYVYRKCEYFVVFLK